MITHLGLFFIIILSYEFLKYVRFPNLIKKNFRIYKKILKLFSFKKVSDHWKQTALLIYSRKLIFFSLKIIIFLSFIFILLMIFIFFDKNFYNLILSLFGILEAIFISIIYYFLRKNINAKL